MEVIGMKKRLFTVLALLVTLVFAESCVVVHRRDHRGGHRFAPPPAHRIAPHQAAPRRPVMDRNWQPAGPAQR